MKFIRNPISKNEQSLLKKTPIAIVGLGGVGGFALENLLRMGAENLILFDHDRFELSNFNRQILSNDSNLDSLKINAGKKRAKEINANAKVKCYKKFRHTKEKVIIDATDNLLSRIKLSKFARSNKIPYIFASANDTRGIVTVFKNYSFEKAFQVAKKNPSICSSVICPAASLSGSIAAMQVLNLLIKKPVILAPKALFFDLSKKDPFWMVKL